MLRSQTFDVADHVAAASAFLKLVAGDGPIWIEAKTATGHRGKAIRDVSRAAMLIAALAADRRTVYFAPSRFDGTRDKVSARSARAYWLDIDSGPDKPYPDADAAAEAVTTFAAKIGLPAPLLVNSGRGIHAYWPLTEDVLPDEWQLCASALKTACVKNGLNADPHRTADRASLMRPVGALHLKGEPIRVVLRQHAEATSPATIAAALAPYISDSATNAPMAEDHLPPDMPAHARSIPFTPLAERAPVSATLIADRCGVIGRLRETRGNVPYPEWFAGLSILARCQDGRDLAHTWSQGHPNYSEDETDRQLSSADAPVGCSYIKGHAPSMCGACRWNGHVKGPIHLGEAQAPLVIDDRLDDLDRFRLSTPRDTTYKRRPVHGGLGYRGQVTLLASKGGQAKSTYVTGAMLAVATGQNLLGVEPGPKGPVMMINGEDAEGEVRLKFQAAYRHHRCNPTDLRNVVVMGAEDVAGITLTELDPKSGRERTNQAGLNTLRRWIGKYGARFVALDPLAAFIPYGMNDNGLAAQVMQGLNAIAVELDCAILLVAHTKKGSDAARDGAEGAAGAGAFVNLSRGVMAVQTPSIDAALKAGASAGDAKFLRELVSQKANLAPLDERQFFKLVGVYMRNGTPEYPGDDSVGVATAFTAATRPWQPPTPVLKTVLETLARGTLQAGVQVTFSPKPQGREVYFIRAVADAIIAMDASFRPDARQLAKATVEAALNTGLASIETVKTASYRNNRQGILVNWRSSQWAVDALPGPFAR